jgi:hypothetical protein
MTAHATSCQRRLSHALRGRLPPPHTPAAHGAAQPPSRRRAADRGLDACWTRSVVVLARLHSNFAMEWAARSTARRPLPQFLLRASLPNMIGCLTIVQALRSSFSVWNRTNAGRGTTWCSDQTSARKHTCTSIFPCSTASRRKPERRHHAHPLASPCVQRARSNADTVGATGMSNGRLDNPPSAWHRCAGRALLQSALHAQLTATKGPSRRRLSS